MHHAGRTAVLTLTGLALALWAGISVHGTPSESPDPRMVRETTLHRLHMPKDIALPDGPLVAIVIDDMGQDRAASLSALTLPGRVTYSFLPYGSATREVAEMAKAQGDEVAVHMPMQPWSKRRDPGPDALTLDLPPAELERRINANLAKVPGYTGVNNHMGSRFSERPEGLSHLFAMLEKRDIWYLDSRTSRETVADAVAAERSLRYARRDVFLDDDSARLPFQRQLAEAESRARAKGVAVIIAHPRPDSLRSLRAWLETAEARGFHSVTISEAIAAQARRSREERLGKSDY